MLISQIRSKCNRHSCNHAKVVTWKISQWGRSLNTYDVVCIVQVGMAATPDDAAGAVIDGDGGVCLPAALRTTLQLGSTTKLSEAGPSWLLISGLQLLGLSVAEGGSIRGFYMSLAVAPEGGSAATRPLLRDEDPNTAVLAWKDRLVLQAPLQDPQCTLTLQVSHGAGTRVGDAGLPAAHWGPPCVCRC